jgi:uncharacterized protein (DUF1330 family)
MILDKVDPTPDSIKQLVADYPADQPVVMLNILRFVETTESGEEGETVYRRYSANAVKHLEKTGAKVLWAGKVVSAVIGNHDDKPHQILLVEYATVQQFLGMVMSPEYQAITKDRTMSLEYGGLYACQHMMK